jgi:hypothetical protein
MDAEVLAFLHEAHDRGNTPTLAAVARANGGTLPAFARRSVAGLHRDGVALAHAGEDDLVVLHLGPAATADADDDHPPHVLTTPKLRKALLGVLCVTRPEPGHLPYPGRTAPLDDAIAVTRPRSAEAARHIRGAITTLHHLGYCVITTNLGAGHLVRPGPQLACWDDPWVRDELPLLLDRLVGPGDER